MLIQVFLSVYSKDVDHLLIYNYIYRAYIYH